MAFTKNPGDLADLVQGFTKLNTNEQVKAEHFLTERLMNKSSVLPGRQDEVFSKLLDVIDSNKLKSEAGIQELQNFARQENILDDLKTEFSNFFDESRGKALRKQVFSLSKLAVDGSKLSDPVTWQTFANTNQLKGAPAEIKRLHDSAMASWQNSALSKNKNFSFVYDSAASAEFMVKSKREVSHSVSFKLITGNQAIKLDISGPSESGFLVNYSKSGGRETKGTHIFSPYPNVITDAERVDGKFKGMKPKSFVDAELDFMQQTFNSVDDQMKAGSFGTKSFRFQEKQFKTVTQSLQQEVGPAAIFGGKKLTTAAQGQLEFIERGRVSGVAFEPFQRIEGLEKQGFSKLGSDLFDIGESRGVKYPGSMQQTAKGIGVLGAGFETPLGAGIGQVGANKEALKMLKQYPPTKTARKHAPKFGPHKAFRPVVAPSADIPFLGGKQFNRAIVTYFDPDELIRGAATEAEAIKARQMFGEGSAIVKQSVFERGAFDIERISKYQIDMRDLFGKLEKGAHPSVVRAIEEFQKTGKSTLIKPGAYIGMEAGTGKIINAMQDKSVQERIINLTKEGETLTIHTQQKIPGMIREGVARQDSRIIGTGNLLKSMATPVKDDSDIFHILTKEQHPDAEMGIRAQQLKKGGAAGYRTATSGAAAFSLGRVGAREEIDALKTIGNMSTMDLANIITKQEGQTFGGKAASFVVNELKKAGRADLSEEVLSNVLAVHNRWGSKNFQIGKEVEPLFGDKVHTQVEKELAGVLGNDPKKARRILSGTNRMKSIMEFRVPGHAKDYGYGVKGTLEPRFANIARTSGLSKAYGELLSRATNFAVPLAELKTAGEVAEGAINYTGMAEEIEFDKMFKDPQSWGQGKARLVRMPKAFGLPEQIYVPSSKDMNLMDMYLTSNQISKSKGAREAFQTFFEEVKMIQENTSKASTAVKATETFNRDIRNLLITMTSGQPGGDAKGVLRGTVEGSLYLPNIAMGESALSPQYAEAVKYVEGKGGSAADIMVMSKKSIRKMYGDAIATAESTGQQKLANMYKAQRTALLDKDFRVSLENGATMMQKGVAWRHPGIGPGSLSATWILPDMSEATNLQHYVKGLEYEVAFDAELKGAGGKAFSIEKGRVIDATRGSTTKMKAVSGAMQAMGFDFDGDAFVLGSIGDQDAQSELTKQLTGRHSEKHALRYQAMEDLAKANIRLDYPSTASTAVRSARAASAAKNVVPQLSNVFTEMKNAIAASNLGGAAKIDLFHFMAAAEQVPISGKKLIDMPDVARVFYDKSNALRSAVKSSSAAQAGGAAGDLFDFIFGSQIKEVKISGEYKGAQEVRQLDDVLNLEHMRKNFVDVASEYAAKDSMDKSFFNAYMKQTTSEYGEKFYRGAESDMGTLWKLFKSQDALNMSSRDVEQWLAGSRAQASRNVQGSIAEGIEHAGRSAAGKLPSKGIIGIAAIAAAGVVAASVSGIALGPSFSSGSGGSKRTIEDLSMFKDEMNPFLHQGGIYNPRVAHLNAGAQPETRVHLPSGGYSREGMQAMVGSVNAAMPSAESRIEMIDGRADIDKHMLYRIKNEII